MTQRRRQRFERATPFQVLEEIAPSIVRSLDAQEIVETVARLTQRVIDYHNFRLYRWEEATESLILVKSVARAPVYNHPEWLEGALRIGLGQGVTGVAAQTRRTILVRDASKDPRIYYAPAAERLEETVLCVPMVAGDQLLGVMSLSRLGAGSLGAAERRLMDAVAAQTALALANADRFAEAEQTIRTLAALEQAQREFILVASHEFHGPLAVISGYASMLEDGSLGYIPDSVGPALRAITTKATEMQALVDRMLQVARLEEGLDAFRSDQVEICELARDAVQRIRTAVEVRQGRIDLDVPGEPVYALADAKALASVLDNLLQNASKFSLEPPLIKVRVRSSDPIEVEVEDCGVGIPSEAQARLFQKFFRADHVELRHVGGTGLGLYLVRGLLEAMGGRIRFRTVPGEGTSFIVAIRPAVPAVDEAHSDAHPKRIPSRT